MPFLDAGAGLYLGLKKLGEDSDHETTLRFGINFGGGVEFFATRSINVSVDLKYHLILDGGEYGSFSYGPSQFFSIGAVMLFNRR
jgi:hypothetical protein